MIQIRVLIIILSILFTSSVFGQATHRQSKPLEIGDTIPNEVWKMSLQVVNHPERKETITLADYKDKLIVIDFWATWCVPCIRSLHKLDTLQDQFENEIAVIPTTYEDAKDGAVLLDKQGISLFTVVSDTTLRQYFPYRSIPHQVWVKNNKVRAIIHSEDATMAALNDVLRNDGFTFHTKKDILDYSRTESISTYAERVGSPVLLSSILTEYIEGVPASVSRAKTEDTSILSYTNLSIIKMYQRTLKVPNNRILVHSSYENKYVYISGKGNDHQRFSYQLKIPNKTPTALIRNRILDDLNFHFQLNVDSQIMNMDCYVISDIEQMNNQSQSRKLTESKQEYRLPAFTGLLNDFVSWKPKLPIYINEAKLSGSIAVLPEIFKSIKYHPDEVKAVLELNGLTLKKEKRPVLMYILNEMDK